MAHCKITRRWYTAQIRRVLNVGLLEADIEVFPGVLVHRRVRVTGVAPPPGDTVSQAALHCAIVLLGGKQVILDVSLPDSPESPFVADVYLNELTAHTTMTWATTLPVWPDQHVIDYRRFLEWMGALNYDVAHVRRALNT